MALSFWWRVSERGNSLGKMAGEQKMSYADAANKKGTEAKDSAKDAGNKAADTAESAANDASVSGPF